jgi:hypothetical protein
MTSCLLLRCPCQLNPLQVVLSCLLMEESAPPSSPQVKLPQRSEHPGPLVTLQGLPNYQLFLPGPLVPLLHLLHNLAYQLFLRVLLWVSGLKILLFAHSLQVPCSKYERRAWTGHSARRLTRERGCRSVWTSSSMSRGVQPASAVGVLYSRYLSPRIRHPYSGI